MTAIKLYPDQAEVLKLIARNPHLISAPRADDRKQDLQEWLQDHWPSVRGMHKCKYRPVPVPHPDVPDDFGPAFRWLWNRTGRSKTDIWEKLSHTPKRQAMMENGNLHATPDLAKFLASIFRCTPEELVAAYHKYRTHNNDERKQ